MGGGEEADDGGGLIEASAPPDLHRREKSPFFIFAVCLCESGPAGPEHNIGI